MSVSRRRSMPFEIVVVVAFAAGSSQAQTTAAPAVLDPVTVVARPEPAYVAPTAAQSSKTDVPLLETPMAVQVVPREVLNDQRAFTLKEALKNVSGVIQPQYDFYDFLQIRGFDNGYAANYRNGLQLQAISGIDLATVEQVEVIKGPASMLYGRIEPGGLVNRVMKSPQARPALSADVQLGDEGLRRATADVTGALDAAGTLLVRLIGAHTQHDSFMDYVKRRNDIVYGAINWRPNRRFELNASLEWQDYRFVDTEDIGIPIVGDRPADVPRHRFYGDPVNWEIPNRQNRTLLAFDWTYALDDRWKLTQRFHYDRRDEQQLTFWFNGFDGVSVMDRGVWFVQPERTTVATNLDLAGDLTLAGVRHRVLVGADAMRKRETWRGFSGTTDVVPPIDIHAPTYGVSGDALRALPENFFYIDRDQWFGFYAQDQISLGDRWQLLVGGRYDVAKTGFGYAETSLAEAGDALLLEQDKAFSPRIGVLYRLSPEASVYASAVKSFGTNNGRPASGVPFDPQEARQVEIGAKFQRADGRLTASASLFRLTKTNVLTADPSTPDPSDQAAIGEVRSQGLEIDVLGQVARQASLIASYALTNTRVTRDNDGNEGHRLPNVPRHAGSLWAKFDSAPGERSGWEVGAGLYARSQREGDLANSWQLPGYARVDAMARYRTVLGGGKVSIQINVENLFDRTYFDRGGSGGTGAKYGSPRAASATLSLEL